jgi:hypothetical protein
LADREVDGLASESMELSHWHCSRVSDIEAGLDQVAQLQEPQAELIEPRLRAVNHSSQDQIVQNAVGRGGMEPCGGGEGLQTHRLGLLSQGI